MGSSARDSDYERETKKVFDSNRKLYLNSVKLGKKILLDPVHMLYDYDPDGTIGAGTRLNVRQANRALKPFNMKVVSTGKGKYILVVQRDYGKPVPTNWCEAAEVPCWWVRVKMRRKRSNRLGSGLDMGGRAGEI